MFLFDAAADAVEVSQGPGNGYQWQEASKTLYATSVQKNRCKCNCENLQIGWDLLKHKLPEIERYSA